MHFLIVAIIVIAILFLVIPRYKCPNCGSSDMEDVHVLSAADEWHNEIHCKACGHIVK